MSEQQPVRSIALVGFGEVGTIFGTDLVAKGLALSTYDVLLEVPAAAPAMRERARAAGVTTCSTLGDAGVTYPTDGEFSWRAVADALAAGRN